MVWEFWKENFEMRVPNIGRKLFESRTVASVQPPLPPPCIYCINMMKNHNNDRSSAVSEEKVVPVETVTSEKIFGRLGPPPKQPRTQKFVP